jgi:hypothetical protein
LAGAIHARADYIETFNRRDFPALRLRNWDVEAIGPDELVSDLFGHSLRDLISEEKSLGSGASTSRIAPRASTR